MLVLSRKLNEVIVITKDGEEVARVCVARVERNRVRLGLIGDDSIGFYREEIYNTRNNAKDHTAESNSDA